jgi:hypothetical protein
MREAAAPGIDAALVASKSSEENKLFIRRDLELVKVEANHVLRGTLLPVEHKPMFPAARDFFATGLSLPTLARTVSCLPAPAQARRCAASAKTKTTA